MVVGCPITMELKMFTFNMSNRFRYEKEHASKVYIPVLITGVRQIRRDCVVALLQ